MMDWKFYDVEFDYHKPSDFIGGWVNAFCVLFKGNYSVDIIPMIIVLILWTMLSLVIMVIYYITLPLRFVVDLLCALYTKVLDYFYG